jgi:redox-sensitive bicupin YhaK (pirin superfamily)
MLLRKAATRGVENFGWLTERYSFSFGGYHDNKWMGFRSLRVLNESVIKPNTGFPMHSHANIEVISFILEGSYRHLTSAGHVATLQAGQLQVISAGTGISHSAYNAGSEMLRMLQIWLLCDRKGGEPRYLDYTPEYRNRWGLVASPDGQAGSVPVRQQAELYVLASDASDAMRLPATKRRYAWLQIVDGEVLLNALGITLGQGDGVGLEGDEIPTSMRITRGSRVVLFLMD